MTPPYVVPNANPNLVLLSVTVAADGEPWVEETPIVAWALDPELLAVALANEETPNAYPVTVDDLGSDTPLILDRATGQVIRPCDRRWATKDEAIAAVIAERTTP